MRIDLNDTISDIPVRRIRKMLKKSRVLSIESVREELEISEKQAADLLDELISRELIRPDSEMAQHSETPYWRTTINGNAFAMAKAGKPIVRKSAEEIFTRFMERVREVCANPYYLYKVKTVVLFGSYLSDSSTMNDIDIAIEVVPKETNTERFGELLEQRREFLLQEGKHPNSILEYASLPQIEVYRFLKSRSRALSLHDISDTTWESTKHLVVHQDEHSN
jgi:predicted nucleotidyltransferase